jgi:hypothetical protein
MHPSCEAERSCICGRDDLIVGKDLKRHISSPFCVTERIFKLLYARVVLCLRDAVISNKLAAFDKACGNQTTDYQNRDWAKANSVLAEGRRCSSYVRWLSTLPRLTESCRNLDCYFGQSPYPSAYSAQQPKRKPRRNSPPWLPPSIPEPYGGPIELAATKAISDIDPPPTEADAATTTTSDVDASDSSTIYDTGFNIKPAVYVTRHSQGLRVSADPQATLDPEV